jgi:hypothetical protein
MLALRAPFRRCRRVRCVVGSIGGRNASAKLHQLNDVAGRQGNAVDHLRVNDLADGGVACLREVSGTSSLYHLTEGTDAQVNVHRSDPVDAPAGLRMSDGLNAGLAGGDLIGAGHHWHIRRKDRRPRRRRTARNTGDVVGKGDLGASNTRAGRFTDDATDRAAAGLGPGRPHVVKRRTIAGELKGPGFEHLVFWVILAVLYQYIDIQTFE